MKPLHRMTDAEFKAHIKGKPFHEAYPLEQEREAAILAAKAKRFKTALYIVEPLEHGNGGWYGSKVLDVVSARRVFGINPVRAYLDGCYDPSFGSHIRACRTPNPSDPVYLWDHENGHWLSKSGKALRGAEARREANARKREERVRQQAFARIARKLTAKERALVGL